ncbi:MAG: acyl-CoA dehydrogenase [Gammaproteobacteria bacterium]
MTFVLLIWIVALLVGLVGCAFLRVPLWITSIWIVIWLGILISFLPSPATVGVTLVGLAILVLINRTPLRKSLLTKPLLRAYRRVLPTMSTTEKEALAAGTVWWEGELFSGRPHWSKLLNIPKPELTLEERAFLSGPVETLCGMLDDWKITHEWADLPPEVWNFLKTNRFFALIIPKSYGGLEFSSYAHSEILLRIATRSITAASVVAVPNSLGPAELLLHYGTTEQKRHYLPRLARGDEIPCFALTGPYAGSDAASIPDIGIVCRGSWDGQTVLGLRLNFEKRYITLAPVATLIGLAFKLLDPDHLLSEQEDRGITCALIPRNLPGLEIGYRHFPLNIPFQNGPIRGRDVFIPLDQIIGGPALIGHGWRMLMENLAAGRSISLPAHATGAAQTAVLTTGAYARIRRQFHTPIGWFEGVQEILARMGGTLYAMDAVRTMTVGANDLGEIPAVPSAIVKYHVTEMGRQIALDAIDIHGGKGIILGPKNYLGRGFQAAPIAITVEGANILTRNMIIFGQGAIRCHPFVLKEMEAAQNPDGHAALATFDRALWAHVGFFLSNMVRAWTLGFHAAHGAQSPTDGPTRRFYQHLERYSAAFAVLSDAAMLTLGGKLKRKERLSARLGDLLSYLYIASAVLKRFEDDGRPVADLPLVEWACRHLIYQFQEQAHDFLRNFPKRGLAFFLRAVIFPTGRTYSAPSDHLGRTVAELLTSPNETRARLTSGVSQNGPAAQPIAQLEEALTLASSAEQLEHKIRDAHREIPTRILHDLERARWAKDQDILTADEYATLEHFYSLVSEIISVDAFPPDALGTKPIPLPWGTQVLTGG